MPLTKHATSLRLVLVFSAALAAVPTRAAEAGPWRREHVEVAVPAEGTSPAVSRREVRVVRGDGTPVTVGEGLADVGLAQRLEMRARPDSNPRALVMEHAGRGVVVALAAGASLVGVGMVVVGGALAAVNLVAPGTALPDPARGIVGEGLFVLVAGVAALAAGMFVAGVALASGAWRMWTAPPSAEPATLQRLGAQLSWQPDEAEEVVRLHNARMTSAPAATAPAVPPLASPEVPPAPGVAEGETGSADAVRPLPPPPPPPPPPPEQGTRKKKKGRR